jgi:hypothetical protein
MHKRPRSSCVRKGQTESRLSQEEFSTRFQARSADPAFCELSDQIEELLQVPWDGHRNASKSHDTRKAGNWFADPT